MFNNFFNFVIFARLTCDFSGLQSRRTPSMNHGGMAFITQRDRRRWSLRLYFLSLSVWATIPLPCPLKTELFKLSYPDSTSVQPHYNHHHHQLQQHYSASDRCAPAWASGRGQRHFPLNFGHRRWRRLVKKYSGQPKYWDLRMDKEWQ